MNQLNKFSTILLHGLFLVLMGMAVLLYKERLFADASYYFFHAINSGWFHVEHGRIVLGVSQIFPLIGYYLGFSLKILMVLASVGHELFYYGIFLLIFYKLKDRSGGIAVLLIHVIGQLWLYYSPMLEICYGAVFVVLMYSILRREKYKDDKWMIVLLLSQWFAMTSHPENFLLIAFVLAYDFLNRGFHMRIHIASIVFFVIGFIVKLLTLSEYETAHLNTSTSAIGGWSKIANGEYIGEVFTMLLEYFPEVILFSVVSIVLLISKKQVLKTGLYFGAFLGLLLAVNLKSDANVFSRYYESMYNPLVFLSVFIFMYEIPKMLPDVLKTALKFILIGVVAIRIVWIWDFGQILQKRVTQLERITDYAQALWNTKYIITEENYKQEYSQIAWSQPIETLLFSAMDGKESTVSIPTLSDLEYQNNAKRLTDSTFIFRRFDLMPNTFLNDRFFKLNKTAYQFLNTNSEEYDYKLAAENTKIALVLPEESLVFNKGDTVLQTIHLFNNSDVLIPSSSQSQTFIACHWYKNDEIYLWDGMRNHIEVDLKGEYIQDIQLRIPKEAGDYKLQPDIVVEGKAWFNLKNSYEVTVR